MNSRTSRWDTATSGRQKTNQLERLQLPTLDLDEVGRLLDDFEHGFESHSNAERKHLLHKLVKEVRVQSKVATEVWYAFPRPAALPVPRTEAHGDYERVPGLEGPVLGAEVCAAC